ncbi:cytochrome c oxidase subunit 2A [Thalassotalea aquiviva]
MDMTKSQISGLVLVFLALAILAFWFGVFNLFMNYS